ncbi:MAG: SagB/ThcOx family dehydrogenase [Chloroflexota bacterium]
MSTSPGKTFWQDTKPQNMPESAQTKGLPQPSLELPYDPAAPLIKLSHPSEVKQPPASLWDCMAKRVTLRRYAETALNLDELSLLLWYTQGVKEVTARPVTFRTVPSAGARHAFETYLLVNRVNELDAGIYRYIALEHALLAVDFSSNTSDLLTQACFNQRQVAFSAVTFFWAAAVERMQWRYPERGYRYLLLDAGHVCQNLYLAAEGLGCGVCAIAAYDDDALNAALGLDGENLFVVYAASLGKRSA